MTSAPRLRRVRYQGLPYRVLRSDLERCLFVRAGQPVVRRCGTLEEEIERLRQNADLFLEVNMGGTAIGTKLNASEGFPEYCAAHLAELTGKPIYSSEDLIAATSDLHGFVMYSSALRGLAALVVLLSHLVLIYPLSRETLVAAGFLVNPHGAVVLADPPFDPDGTRLRA
mgnify:CR=1 FL=1